jgi:hypothetical protein
MEQKSVSALEQDLENAILRVVMRAVKGRRIPILPSHRTLHLMAKAAVVVYETAVEVSESESRESALAISSAPESGSESDAGT